MHPGYEATANKLVERIEALGPQILSLESAWDLFSIPEFKCDDLNPSAYQAGWALQKAKENLKAKEKDKCTE